jgi:hypothetical protein
VVNSYARYCGRRILLVALALGFTFIPQMATASCGWKAIASPNVPNSGNGFLGVSAISASDVWAVGTYLNPGRHTLTEHWNGHVWTIVPSPSVRNSASVLLGVSATSPADAWGAGFYFDSVHVIAHSLTERWNGHTWAIVPSPNANAHGNYMWGVSASSPTDAWIAGNYTSNPTARTIAEHWNGRAWTIVPSPNANANQNQIRGIAAMSPSDAWMDGWFSIDGNVDHTLVEHWNGKGWTVVPSPNANVSNNNRFFGISAISASAAWAAGFFTGTDGIDHTLVEQWNGNAWAVVPSPNAGGSANHFNGISAASSSSAWAVGYYHGNDNVDHTLIEHWNGQAWAVVPSPNASTNANYLFGVSAISASEAWAAGYYTGSDNVLHTLVEHWKC